MKKSILLFMSVSIGVLCHAQNMQKERIATFPGGNYALNKFVLNHINYPKTAADSKIEGIVYVSFAVEKDGTVDSVQIIQGVKACPALDKEASRIVAAMPKWSPGLDEGKPYVSQLEVPIQFVLNKHNTTEAR